MHAITPNLWINGNQIEEAVDHYVSLFEDGRVVSSADYGPDAGEQAGQKMVVNFELHGQPFAAINGGSISFTPNESLSLAVPCDTQAEIDHLWEGLVAGGTPGPCGWLKDRFGFSWQVYPTRLDAMMSDPDPEKVGRVVACFMAIDGRPFDLAELEAAYAGETAPAS